MLASILAATSRTLGATARKWASRSGNSVMWLASGMQMQKVRVDDAGSNAAFGADSSRSVCSTARTLTIRTSARGVGSMPAGVRTNSASPSSARSVRSQMLAVGWRCPIISAAWVTLPVL